MKNNPTNEFHERTLEAMRQQQDAYVSAVRAWRRGLTDSPTTDNSTTPGFPGAADLSNTAEVARASYLLAVKLLEDQRKFLNNLNEAMGEA